MFVVGVEGFPSQQATADFAHSMIAIQGISAIHVVFKVTLLL
jgi:hypothetical protein